MRIPRTLAIVLAGGKGSRMGALTDRRTKPALRIGGSYRLIDVALSNLANSHLSTVWVAEQYLPHSLNEHLSGGRPWDLDRNHGGLRTLAPFEGAEGEGFATGNSDTLWRQKELIAQFEPELVVTLSADHLYTINLLDVLDTHAAADADLTMVTTRTSGDASRHGVVRPGADGAVEEFWYKPEEPPTDLVATEIFCFDGPTLVEVLTTLPERVGELQDWGDDLVPTTWRTCAPSSIASRGTGGTSAPSPRTGTPICSCWTAPAPGSMIRSGRSSPRSRSCCPVGWSGRRSSATP